MLSRLCAPIHALEARAGHEKQAEGFRSRGDVHERRQTLISALLIVTPLATIRGQTTPIKDSARVAVPRLLADTVDEPIQIIRIPKPKYPKSLQLAYVSGSVETQFIVDTLGHAEPASWRVLKSTHPEFEAPAREAILKGAFKPARIKGRAVRQLVQQTISFNPSP